MAFKVRTAFVAKDEVPALNCPKVFSQKRLLSPVIEEAPLQKVTCPAAPDPETPPVERQTLLIA